ncbi:glycosyltransferase family 4 protein [Stieleria sp. TO1_6]|uniref:glycosyltransferase family 4 protein n=1 Tax=Stieleria tagensis TaxID=2956795 RepID=UPI00209B655E|nr:glycosyltransferase family 4 protein [Stieleria tagensis]MCO8121411.1 glycosyltransferase family 4 protein [Stieleria tagensis]
MKRVLFVYESLATPSTMVRGLQFRECVEKDPDIDARFIGRTSERMNQVMQRWPWRPSLRRPALAAEAAVSQRRESQIVQLARDCDLVVMMTVPSWSLHQRLAKLPDTRLVTDLIDALWLPSFQKQGWEHVHEMLATSDAVICENEFTARYTRDLNDTVFVVPDAPQIEAFDRVRHSIQRDPTVCRIGWIGGKYTADALYRIFEPLETVFQSHDQIHLRLVGADPDRLPRFENVRYSVVPSYDQQRMIQEALAMDIGVFPMFDVAESLYRGTLKSRVYMSAEAAVIGQRLGENCSLIDDGVTGLLAGSDQEWIDSLQRLIGDSVFRKRLASAGRQQMTASFSRQACYEQLRQSLLSVMNEGSSDRN